MLSYLHGFHAGNHADVLKHLCLMALLTRLTAKPSPLCYFDSHAGAGCYPLDHPDVEKTGEHALAAGKLQDYAASDPLLRAYIEQLQQHAQRSPADYPGSPQLAQTLLREQDQLQLCELHPTEFEKLQRWSRRDARIHVHHCDGHDATKALLPPAEKRGLVLIDPSYENKSEYAQCLASVLRIRKHFRSACIALWYPRLPRDPAADMQRAILKQAGADTLLIHLDVTEPLGDFGMYGSAMLIIQPPWQIEDTIQTALAEVAPLLGPHTRYSAKRHSHE